MFRFHLKNFFSAGKLNFKFLPHMLTRYCQAPDNIVRYCKQGRAETFGGAGAQSIKGAHGTRLLIGMCSLRICVSKWMLVRIRIM